MSTKQAQVLTAPTGKFQVNVVFNPMGNLIATGIKSIIQPDGQGWVYITHISGNKYKLQFCDSSGNIGSPAWSSSNFGDYAWPASKLYAKNHMPVTLAFDDVTFLFDDITGNITEADGVLAKARPNGNPDGYIPSEIAPQQTSDPTKSGIATTTSNTSTAFTIKVDLGFELPFRVELTKI